MGLLQRFTKWRRRRQLRKAFPGSAFTSIRRPDGTRMIVDEATAEYMRSTAPQPTQVSLDAILARVHGVRVYKNGGYKDTLVGGHVLLAEATDRGSLTELADALRIVEGPSGHCMCHGSPTLELLGSNSRRLALLSVHHGRSIRWTGWKDDAVLVDGSKLVAWLAARGIPSDKEGLSKGTG